MMKCDFKTYDNIEDVKHYSVFIRPDGKMYRIWNFEQPLYSEDEYYISHTGWSREFLNSDENLDFKTEYKNYTKEQVMMEIYYITAILGFVGYSRTPNINDFETGIFGIFPPVSSESELFNFEYTDIQIERIKQLKELNHDTLSKDCIEQISYMKKNSLFEQMLMKIAEEDIENTRRTL